MNVTGNWRADDPEVGHGPHTWSVSESPARRKRRRPLPGPPIELLQGLPQAWTGRLAIERPVWRGLHDPAVRNAEVVIRDSREVVVQRVGGQADRRPQLGPGSAWRIQRITQLSLPISGT